MTPLLSAAAWWPAAAGALLSLAGGAALAASLRRPRTGRGLDAAFDATALAPHPALLFDSRGRLTRANDAARRSLAIETGQGHTLGSILGRFHTPGGETPQPPARFDTRGARLAADPESARYSIHGAPLAGGKRYLLTLAAQNQADPDNAPGADLATSNEDLRKNVEELTTAFKKSSKHHIQLQKALMQNEMQRKELQAAVNLINRQKEELEQANDEIKQQSRLKEIFLANTSHEIRTPLNAIIGLTNLLIKRDLDETSANYLKNIKTAGDNLLVVLNDILDISKIEAGKIILESIPFQLTELVAFLFSTMEAKALEKNHTMEYDIDPDIPPILVGDPTRLNQVLLNLVSNAVKFTPADGAVRCRARLAALQGDRATVRFEVEDNGIGMSADQLPNLFMAFTQAEDSTTRKFGGTGLGLSIVKNLIELQNGEIHVESAPGRGTTFIFTIEYGVGHETQQADNAAGATTIEDHEAENLRILLVEDNKINQLLAHDTITLWHKAIKVDIAENGAQALEMLAQDNYSLILMDIQMPTMDGLEATRHIRNGEVKGKENIPIIAMTAHALRDEKERCLSSGMNDYVTKPFDPESLYSKILHFGCQHMQIIVKGGKMPPQYIEPGEKSEHPETAGITEQPAAQPLTLKEADAAAAEQPKTAASQAAAAAPRFRHMALDELDKIYDGNPAQIRKILALYHTHVGGEIDGMSADLAAGQMPALGAKAHTLKPKMAYIGREDLRQLAAQIEATAKTDGARPDDPALARNMATIAREWEMIDQEIANYLTT